jgi:tetratricopeptide (TPR) repeat protein
VPRDWDLAERFARQALDMAEKFDAPVEVAAALGSLADAYGWRGLLRERLHVVQRRLAVSRDPRCSDMRQRVLVLIDAGDALLLVGEFAEAMPILQEAQGLAHEMQAINLEKAAFDQRLRGLFQLDRWDEILGMDARLREMQRLYPLEQIGVSCFEIAMVASVHALRGELDLAVSEREESNTIMTAISGPTERWGRWQHF